VLLLLPATLLFLAVFVVPQVWLFARSLYPKGSSGPSLSLYGDLLTDPYDLSLLWHTFVLGAVVAAGCALLGFPLAYQLARSTSRVRGPLLILTVFPLLTSAVVRTFGWQVLFYRTGVLGQLAPALGLGPQLVGTFTGVVIALVEVLLPFMVLTCYGVVRGVDPGIEEAALDLGDPPWRVLFRVTLPLCRGGLLAGSLLVFSLTVSSFVTPALIGGSRVQVAATAIYERTITLVDYPRAAALAVVLLVLVAALIAGYSRLLALPPSGAGS
jgi:putative spermidine/putrescine transport system permease protein